MLGISLRKAVHRKIVILGEVWNPRETKRSVGKPRKRWIDYTAGKQWMKTAKDRKARKQLKEAYIKHWINES